MEVTKLCTTPKPFLGAVNELWKVLSYKKTTPGSGGVVVRVLVTGSAGDALIFKLLQSSLNQSRSNASMTTTVVADANLAVKIANADAPLEFDYVVHLVVDPLKSIATLASAATNRSAVQANLRKALYTWISTHQFVDMYCDVTLRIRQLPSAAQRLSEPRLAVFARLRKQDQELLEEAEKLAPGITWNDLFDADPFMAAEACRMAHVYHFSCPRKIVLD